MYKIHEIKYCGVVYEVHFYYEDGEPQTYDYCGSPAVVEIDRVCIEGLDITEIVSQNALDYFDDCITEDLL